MARRLYCAAPVPQPKPAPDEYRRREPESTLFYSVVESELPGLRDALAQASPYGTGLPKHVDRDLAAYLKCGLLQHGFARVLCRRCRAEHLVAFSCKGRICPSCSSRRMSDTAAHLVDRVLPYARYRQWVVTFPRRVRHHLAADPKLVSEALREVLRVLFAWQRRRARRVGVRPDRAHSNGAVTFVQRFNSAIELSLHFHILIPDGVFISDGDDIDARPRFVEIDPPTDPEVAALLDKIIARTIEFLRRRGRLDDAIDDEPEPHLAFASRTPTGGDHFVEDALPPLCARKEGFSVHAGVAIHENDRLGLERLARYGLRPPLAQGRLTEASDGQLLYTMKRQFSDGQRVLRFTPREFLFRLCALVPPRGFHMVRYAGIFSAHARGRHALTGRGLRDCRGDDPQHGATEQDQHSTDPLPGAPRVARPTAAPASASTPAPTAEAPPGTSKHAGPPLRSERIDDGPDDPSRARRLEWATLPGPPLRSELIDDGPDDPSRAPGPPLRSELIDDGPDDPSRARRLEWATLPGPPLRSELIDDGPDDPSRARRLEWATLLKRTFKYDVLVCASCGGAMQMIAVVDDEAVAKRILDHLGVKARSPPRRAPWRPGQQDLAFADEVGEHDGVDPSYND